jgi:hypothetical protein
MSQPDEQANEKGDGVDDKLSGQVEPELSGQVVEEAAKELQQAVTITIPQEDPIPPCLPPCHRRMIPSPPI